jgi:hypothetical protein
MNQGEFQSNGALELGVLRSLNDPHSSTAKAFKDLVV